MEQSTESTTSKKELEDNKTKRQTPWLAATLIAISAILAICLLIGTLDALSRRHVVGRVGFIAGPAMTKQGRHRFFGEGSTNQTVIRGTVTSVKGSTWVVAGNGTTNTITTNSSTQYKNGSQVAVNDTIVVIGTVSNNILTAGEAIINPAGFGY